MSLPRSSTLSAALLGLALTAVPAHAATRNCDIQRDARTFGVSYITSLKVTNTTCAKGKKVVRAFHTCRKAKGIRGRCTKRVLGYSCTEARSSISTQFTGKVTCKDGTRRVVHTYTQFT